MDDDRLGCLGIIGLMFVFELFGIPFWVALLFIVLFRF